MGPISYYEIFQGQNKDWYWSLFDGTDSTLIATNGKAYNTREDARTGIIEFKHSVEYAYVPNQASMATSDLIDDLDEDTEDHNER